MELTRNESNKYSARELAKYYPGKCSLLQEPLCPSLSCMLIDLALSRGGLGLDVRHGGDRVRLHTLRGHNHEHHLVSKVAVWLHLIICLPTPSKSTIKQWKTEQSNELRSMAMRNFGSTSFVQFEEEISVSRINYEF